MKDWKFLGTLINELNKDLNKKKRLNQPPSESNNQEGSLDQVVEDVNEDHFLEKLYDVIYKLSIIARTQSFRFKKEWDMVFTQSEGLKRELIIIGQEAYIFIEI